MSIEPQRLSGTDEIFEREVSMNHLYAAVWKQQSTVGRAPLRDFFLDDKVGANGVTLGVPHLSQKRFCVLN